MATAAGLEFVGIPAGKFRRIGGVSWPRQLLDLPMQARNLRDIGRIYRGYRQARRLIADFKPDVVFVKAGGVGLPVGRAAASLGVPVVVHESDIVPGLGTKLLAQQATTIATGFPLAAYKRSGLPAAKLAYVGAPVPVDQTAGRLPRGRKRFRLNPQRPVVLIVGGSRGARSINQAVLAQIKPLTAAAQIIHQAGELDLMQIKSQPAAKTPGYQVYGLLDGAAMGDAYRVADVVVARAGANTIADLAATAKPAIIIPNQVAAAHQLANANWLQKTGAAVILPEAELGGLSDRVSELLGSPDRLQRLSNTIHKLSHPQATQELVQLIKLAAIGGRP